MTFETFDQNDDEIWPDQQKDNDKNKYNEKDKDDDNWKTTAMNNPRDLALYLVGEICQFQVQNMLRFFIERSYCMRNRTKHMWNQHP